VVCGGSVRAFPYFQHASIALFRCKHCESLTALPRPSASEQAALHDNAHYFEHPYFEHRRRSAVAVERRCRAAFAKIGAAIDLGSLRGQCHLDVGCDTGAFVLAAARIWGTTPVGIDIAQRSAGQAARQGIEVHCCTLEQAPAGLIGLSVITAIDLIEHLADPQGFAAEVKRRLRPGGVAYLETPNIASHVYGLGRKLSRVTGVRPAFVFERLFPPEHVQYFSQAGLKKIATDAGLNVISLHTRSLPAVDIAASTAFRVAVSGIQTLDAASGRGILHCMVVRRPD